MDAWNPALEMRRSGEIAYYTDPVLRERHGVAIAFTTRLGGLSRPPYDTLNLAAHVGDVSATVDANRDRLLEALGMAHLRHRLVMAQQVHSETISEVGELDAGAGAFAVQRADGLGAIEATDALLTAEADTPVLMCFADCVPVILVAPRPLRAICVVHAGWKGAALSLPGKAAVALARRAGCGPADLLAYVGPHVGPCHYEVSEDVGFIFRSRFANIRPAPGRVDLGLVVAESLDQAGVPARSRAALGACTAEATDLFFSYRVEGTTGRHGACAAVLGTALG